MTAKEAVLDILKHAPEDSSFEEIQYRIYIREKLQSGLDAVENGDVVSPGQMEAEMQQWSIG